MLLPVTGCESKTTISELSIKNSILKKTGQNPEDFDTSELQAAAGPREVTALGLEGPLML